MLLVEAACVVLLVGGGAGCSAPEAEPGPGGEVVGGDLGSKLVEREPAGQEGAFLGEPPISSGDGLRGGLRPGFPHRPRRRDRGTGATGGTGGDTDAR
ncbi:hypothetical protein ACIOWI_34775, partial [Streptomyces sp. NPDC087659]|uniref:hypothetical protein n=1 Tax=Streptomyces sp. NPDC087659 TaxID=3365801 RepID=UPI0038284B05